MKKALQNSNQPQHDYSNMTGWLKSGKRTGIMCRQHERVKHRKHVG